MSSSSDRELPFNAIRKRLGLPLIQHKKTKCLSCQKTFLSKNYPSIRICKDCKDRADWRTDFNVFDHPHQTYRKGYKTPVEISWSDASNDLEENISINK